MNIKRKETVKCVTQTEGTGTAQTVFTVHQSAYVTGDENKSSNSEKLK